PPPPKTVCNEGQKGIQFVGRDGWVLSILLLVMHPDTNLQNLILNFSSKLTTTEGLKRQRSPGVKVLEGDKEPVVRARVFIQPRGASVFQNQKSGVLGETSKETVTNYYRNIFMMSKEVVEASHKMLFSSNGSIQGRVLDDQDEDQRTISITVSMTICTTVPELTCAPGTSQQCDDYRIGHILKVPQDSGVVTSGFVDGLPGYPNTSFWKDWSTD
ncbi:hypothetical protein A6R68_21726, partial [Neotoma lepida]